MKTKYDLSLRERMAYYFRAKPSVGDQIWWRSRLMKVIDINKPCLRFKYADDRYTCTSSLLEVLWNATWKMWYLPGVEGKESPHIVRGQLVIPGAPENWRDG